MYKYRLKLNKKTHRLVCFWAPPVGLDMHFLSFGEKIKVATSVCTGCRKCPPDTSTAMGSSPPVVSNKKEQIPNGICSFLSLVSKKELVKKPDFRND